MADINFFDMTYDEMLKYKMNPHNHIHTSSALNGDQIIGAGYKAINPFEDTGPRQTVVERDFFAKPRMKEPELWDSGRIVNMENVRIQRAKVKAQMREAQNNAEFDPMNRLVERTPSALATDTRIQQLLSEADTMVRRYNLPASAAHALKVDIMKSHLPDYIVRKDTLTRKQQDDENAKIDASIAAGKQNQTTNNLAPDAEGGGDENRDKVGDGGFEGEDNESVDSADTAPMDAPSPMRPTPATGGTRDPSPAGGGGGDLDEATMARDTIEESARQALELFRDKAENGTTREKLAVSTFKRIFRQEGVDGIVESLKSGSKQPAGYRAFVREAFNLGRSVDDDEKLKLNAIMRIMTPGLNNIKIKVKKQSNK